ncbi:hypothetical protein AX16_001515 [Volvariella volvacea WC 439]|nr:hypothetical protein AX16_001515 [Volvariella volvacea WC 439]
MSASSREYNDVAQKRWKCGTKFWHEKPSTDDDSLQKLNEATKRFDTEMCKNWDEEIGELLTFTGLFTAMLTEIQTKLGPSYWNTLPRAWRISRTQQLSHLLHPNQIASSRI